MQIGLNVPTSGPMSAPDSLVQIAAGAEAMGYDFLSFSDHIVIPDDIHARYPYSETGEFTHRSGGEWLELLTAVAFLAGKTARVRLLTSVMVVPYRPAVLTAKVLSTIDVLSGGRLLVGIGAGWMKEEFEALGTPPYAERGAVTDEYVQAFRELWSKDEPRLDGKYVQFGGIAFSPKPVQRPHLPIWVGGESGPSLRRAARLGDAWYPIDVSPAHPYDSLPRYRAGIARLQKFTTEAGRDPSAVALTFRVGRFGTALPPTAGDGERRLFSGDPADIAADLRAFRELGVTAVDFGFGGATAAEMLAEMQHFRQEVLARLG